MSPPPKTITVLPGDGIGPEVTGAAMRIVDATGAGVQWAEHVAGGKAFERGIASGVPPETVDSITTTRVVLKGPLATPLGKGERSANVTLRGLFETFSNIRPVRELPGVRTPYQGRGVDLVVVRENVEDLYAGIEYMQTPGVAQGLKIISRKGCEKIVRLAFELARAEGRTKVSCATKSNIMKLTEGMLQHTFESIAPEYPDIQAEHLLVDNCAHQLVMAPEQFQVIVMTNMNGDILSDLASGLGGGLGFAPSANIGAGVAIFEAVHGTAPSIAGKDVANPTALLLSAVMMLRFIGAFAEADAVENAILFTLESGVHTADIARVGTAVGTRAFTDAIIGNLGKRARSWNKRDYKPITIPAASKHAATVTAATRQVVGADVFIESDLAVRDLAAQLQHAVAGATVTLQMIANRGTQLFPVQAGETDVIDAWRCRFVPAAGTNFEDGALIDLLQRVGAHHRWTHVEKLNRFDGVDGFSKTQGIT